MLNLLKRKVEVEAPQPKEEYIKEEVKPKVRITKLVECPEM
jgi:hypothetical protein